MIENRQNIESEFADKNNLTPHGDFLYHKEISEPDFSFRESIKPGIHFNFIENPVNPEKAKKLYDPEFIKNYFSSKDIQVISPQSIIILGGSTLFTCAGVQVCDDILQKENDIPNKPIFVAQPVLRTQFLENIGEGTSTSFINTSTISINNSLEQHYELLDTWLEFLNSLGIKDEKLYFKQKDYEQVWGDKIVKSNKLFIIYDGLEIGDASFVKDFPQTNRNNLSFSDIGFGLERIRWILQGGTYANTFTENSHNKKETSIGDVCLHSLTLLSGSGLKPSNKEHGYRFRLFSKRLIEDIKGDYVNLEASVAHYYQEWKKWTKLEVSEEETIKTISKENQRNFNRILIDELKKYYNDVNLDINLSTEIIINRLSGASVDKNNLLSILKELKYHYEE